MASQGTKPALKLRPTDGLLEDVALAVPVGWMEVLRGQSVKLGITVEEMIVQYLGHLSDQVEKVARPPAAGDDPARLVLRDSLRESYRLESVRSGLPMRSILYRVVQAAASVFDGRQYEAAPEPIKMAPRRKAAGK